MTQEALLEFQNANMARNYPLEDAEAMPIPTPLLVDGLLTSSQPETTLYVTHIDVGPSEVQLYVGAQVDGVMTDCAYISFPTTIVFGTPVNQRRFGLQQLNTPAGSPLVGGVLTIGDARSIVAVGSLAGIACAFANTCVAPMSSSL